MLGQMLPQAIAGIGAFLITLVVMPRVIRFAREYRILDYPDSERRVHDEPIPRIGGVAVFISVAIACAGLALWNHLDPAIPGHSSDALVGLVIGATIVFIAGVMDDLRGMSPALKLTAQTFAAVAAIAYGFRIDSVAFSASSHASLGVFALPITVLWIVGITNAFNLIDGIDGLAGTCALVGLTTCAGVDLYLHHAASQIITFALLGAVFAFLRFNHAPAKVFFGDSGSMLLGFFLSINTVSSATTDAHVTYVLVPLFALAYPLADTVIAMTRRWLRGHPISRADGRHVHHQILALGLSPTRTVELVGLFCFSIALMGVAITFAPPQVALALGVGGIAALAVAFFYGVRWLRYSEFQEFGASIASVVLSARRHVRHKLVAVEIADKLQNAASQEEVRTILADSASEFHLLEVSIIPGSPHSPQPATLQISPVSQRPFRVDYPIAWEAGGQVHEVILRLWCERPAERTHLGAVRIASKLGTALERWLAEHPAPFKDATSTDDEAGKRSSPKAGLSRLDS